MESTSTEKPKCDGEVYVHSRCTADTAGPHYHVPVVVFAFYRLRVLVRLSRTLPSRRSPIARALNQRKPPRLGPTRNQKDLEPHGSLSAARENPAHVRARSTGFPGVPRARPTPRAKMGRLSETRPRWGVKHFAARQDMRLEQCTAGPDMLASCSITQGTLAPAPFAAMAILQAARIARTLHPSPGLGMLILPLQISPSSAPAKRSSRARKQELAPDSVYWPAGASRRTANSSRQ
jgi:hypothetical protein